MRVYILFSLIITLVSLVQLGNCFIESIALGAVASGAALLSYTFRCKFYECCDEKNVPRNTLQLRRDLQDKLYGQHIARDIVYTSIHSHVNHEKPRKPLVLSFHGLPGSGKNYVVTMIAKALFKNGEKSSHYHFINGRNDFPLDSQVQIYRFHLKKKISQALDSCERSLFVFDEIDKMPAGILDVLVPFMDYTKWGNELKSKAIFIFLSNTGSDKIVHRMIELWQNGKNRNDINLQDFEPLIVLGAFNEKGGLYKSGTIESKLIDHHIPFLPMEEEHVKKCLNDVFQHWGVNNPSEKLMGEALSHVTYGPSPHNLYSTAGCKRLDHKVSSIIFRDEFDK